MPRPRSFRNNNHSSWSLIRRAYRLHWGGWQVVIFASLMHVLLAAGLFIAGRAQIAPGLVDRDGIMGSFAFDSYEYRSSAIQLAGFLRSGQIASWATAAQPLHLKIIALPFALLGPLLGYGTFTAEPYNVLCYAAVVGLVFLLGREVCNRRAGAMAAVAVAVCPTFVLHTMQLLKDPLFVAGSLVFVLCVTTLLTRTYAPRSAASIAVLTVLMLLMLFYVRSGVVILMLAVGCLGFVLLALRQWLQAKLLLWNMVAAAPILLLGALMMVVLFSSHASESFKQFPAAQTGESKLIGSTGLQVASLIVRLPAIDDGSTLRGRSNATANRLARRAGSMRSRFAASYPESGSEIDGNKEFKTFYDLIAYLPRAVEIGLWAPFPNSWGSTGRRVGNAGKLLAAGEIFLIYFCELFALLVVVREPRRLPLWFILAIAVLGVTALGLLVPNLGALYRFRYAFWFLIIVAAMAGLENLLKSTASVRFERQPLSEGLNRVISLVLPLPADSLMKRYRSFPVAIALAAILAAATAASAIRSANSPQVVRLVNHPAESNEHLDFSLTNFTGTSLRSVYLSPTTAPVWQENVLAGGTLKDGDSIHIHFNPNEKTTTWDLRIEGVDGHYAEWKDFKLGEISEVTLLLKPMPQPTVVAEVQ